jgi:hypothetical protein
MLCDKHDKSLNQSISLTPNVHRAGQAVSSGGRRVGHVVPLCGGSPAVRRLSPQVSVHPEDSERPTPGHSWTARHRLHPQDTAPLRV